MILLVLLNFQSKGEMEDLTVWTLVCNKLDAKDVVKLFGMCKLLRTLSERQGLWSFLMRRDFPEHYKLSLPCDHKMWYQDVYKFGAFFVIGDRVQLFPQTVICSAISLQSPHVVTTRTRQENYGDVFLRTPGQNFVRLTDCYKQRPCLEHGESYLEYAECTMRFGRWTKPDGDSTYHLEKFDDSRWKNVLLWIHTYFVVTKITAMWNDLNFTGRPRKDVVTNFADPQNMRVLCAIDSEYNLVRKRLETDDDVVIELYSYAITEVYYAINQVEIPWF